VPVLSIAFFVQCENKPFEGNVYVFAGLEQVESTSLGVLNLRWSSVPGKAVEYAIFERTQASGEYNFEMPLAKKAFSTHTLTGYGLKADRCFVVRYVSTQLEPDNNTREICSGHKRYEFPGISSITDNGDGSWSVSWAETPFSDVTFSVFQRRANQNYNFSAPIESGLKALAYRTANLAIPGNTCFVVRATYPGGSEISDGNLTELCTGHEGLGEFLGCREVTTLDASSVRVSFDWPKNADEVAVLRNGTPFFRTKDQSVVSVDAKALTSGISYEFECVATRQGASVTGANRIQGAPLSASDFASYQGCVSAVPLGVDQIEVAFAWPTAQELGSASVTEMLIKRGSLVVGSVTEKSTTRFVDVGLQEGLNYTYTCAAKIGGLVVDGRVRLLDVKTLQVNPPLFDGLTGVTQTGASSVRLEWMPPLVGSVPVDKFFVYGNAGSLVDVTREPLAILSPTTFQHSLAGVGEELQYSYAIRACTAVVEETGERLCAWGRLDRDAVTIFGPTVQRQITLPDTGAPKTVGATAVTMSGGAARITAPWNDSLGGITKRYVFYKQGAATSNFADYTGSKVFVVSDPANVPTSLSVDGLADGTDYSFLVRDEDPAGNRNESFAVVSANTGDLTPPSFSGGGTLAHGPSPDSTLSVSFTAITPESLNPNNQGASEYLVYLTEMAGTGNPADPCLASSEPVAQVSAAGKTAGQTVTHSITGLSPRTSYRACVKARDSAGNVSLTQTPATPKVTTIDLTAPSFDGLQSLAYDADGGCLKLTWLASPDSDLKEYQVTLWKDDDPTPALLSFAKTSTALVATGQTLTLCLPKASFDYTDTMASEGNKTYAFVNACDDAAPNYGSQNCSAYSSSNARSVAIPDTDPPAGFAGIASVSVANPLQSGAVTVTWNSPTGGWADYRGFKVYDYDPSDASLTLLRDCPCSANNCPDALTACQVTGLKVYAPYNFYVRAYDATGNQTPVAATPFYITARSTDAQKPVFSSGLSAQWAAGSDNTCPVAGNGACLSWTAASDNQVSTETLRYRVYRKAGSTFTWSGGQPSDGSLIATVADRHHKDPATGLTQGVTYHYTVCAIDAASFAGAAGSAGISCDQVTRSVTVPDLVPPQIFNFSQTLTSASLSNPEWGFTWQISDNLNANNLLKVMVRRIDTPTTGPGSTDFPTLGTPIHTQGLGLTSLSGQTGLPGQHRRIAYLFTVEDVQGNQASRTAEVNADLAVPLPPVITSLSEGDSFNRFLTSINGTCDPNAAYTTTLSVLSLHVKGQAQRMSCVDGNLSFDLHLGAGSDSNLALELTTTKPNGNAITTTRRVDFHRPCPTGYVGVAGLMGANGSGSWDDPLLNAGLGNVAASYNNVDPFLDPGRDFCVMKYPAKAQTSPSNPEGAFQPIDMGEQSFSNFSRVIPDSRPSGRPWTNISQAQSITECGELNAALLGSASPAAGTFSLLSNTQWQVMARSIEATGANWSGGAVHNGVLNRGHTDSSMSTTARQDGADLNTSGLALSHPSDDSRGYYGTGQSSGEQKRTFVLPNGEIVWDVGGNVWQWVRDLKSGLGLMGADDTAVSSGGWVDYGNGTTANSFSESVNLVFGSFGKPGTPHRLQYPSGTNGGRIFGSNDGALLRGGSWNNGSIAGVFATHPYDGPANANSSLAPRCSFLFSESP
jgi:hypothetical protein